MSINKYLTYDRMIMNGRVDNVIILYRSQYQGEQVCLKFIVLSKTSIRTR